MYLKDLVKLWWCVLHRKKEYKVHINSPESTVKALSFLMSYVIFNACLNTPYNLLSNTFKDVECVTSCVTAVHNALLKFLRRLQQTNKELLSVSVVINMENSSRVTVGATEWVLLYQSTCYAKYCLGHLERTLLLEKEAPGNPNS
jgi:hypothetical protein